MEYSEKDTSSHFCWENIQCAYINEDGYNINTSERKFAALL
jgi:hypothetical protein